MCGRYAIVGNEVRSLAEVQEYERDMVGAEYKNRRIELTRASIMGMELATLDRDFVRNFDAAPTQVLPIARDVTGDYEEIVRAQRGLIPPRTKNIPGFLRQYSTFNARAERLTESRLFAQPFRQQRCLVPMNGFYEWQQRDKAKVRHFIRLNQPTLFACAGL